LRFDEERCRDVLDSSLFDIVKGETEKGVMEDGNV